MPEVLTPSFLSPRAVDRVRTASGLVRDTEQGKGCSKGQVSWEGAIQVHGKVSYTFHADPMVELIPRVYAGWMTPDQVTDCDRKVLPRCTKGIVRLVCAHGGQISWLRMHKGVAGCASSRETHATPHHHDITVIVII